MTGQGGIHLELPWPPRELSPNARIHYLAKSRVTKAYREQSYWLTRARNGEMFPCSVLGETPISLAFTFHPPDRRRRDLDTMLSSVKAGIDGIADALGLIIVPLGRNVYEAFCAIDPRICGQRIGQTDCGVLCIPNPRNKLSGWWTDDNIAMIRDEVERLVDSGDYVDGIEVDVVGDAMLADDDDGDDADDGEEA